MLGRRRGRGLGLRESPWLVVFLHTLFSSYGVYAQLHSSKVGQQAAEEVEEVFKLWRR